LSPGWLWRRASRLLRRLIGIDTPESVAPGTPVECGAKAATRYLAELVDGAQVSLTADPTQDRVDRYGRTLAYVDTAQTDVGLEMIRAGLATVYVFDEESVPSLSGLQRSGKRSVR